MNRQLVTVIVATVFAAISATAQNTTTQTRTHSFPPTGLGSTETARVNLTNLATASTGGTAASCAGNVKFLNATGATIGSATNFTIASAQTSSVSLPFSSAGLTAPRGVIRAIVQTTVSTSPCLLQVSFETFETSSGATHLFIGGTESPATSFQRANGN